jgi:hypothetical protein
MNGGLQALVSSRPHRDRRFGSEQKGKRGQGDVCSQGEKKGALNMCRLALRWSKLAKRGGGSSGLPESNCHCLAAVFERERRGNWRGGVGDLQGVEGWVVGALEGVGEGEIVGVWRGRGGTVT